jgi:nucleoside-diphosphate-sugar epimerase
MSEKKLLLTGSTGFVGKYLLHQILETTAYDVTINLRPKKNLSAQERFKKEFLQSTLFGTPTQQHALMNRITILEKETQDIKPADISSIHIVLHCAANTRFFDPAETILRDNVMSVKALVAAANESKVCEKFLFVSTCYVHPKDNSTKGTPSLLPLDLPQASFINTYAYSKYQAETYLSQQLTACKPEICRLSCVGAPLGYLAAHPFRGGAHLGTLELILSQKLLYVWLPMRTKVNIIPVDIAVSAILKQLSQPPPKKTIVKQFCAPDANPSYTLALDHFHTYIQTHYQDLVKNIYFSLTDSFDDFTQIVSNLFHMRSGIPLLLKANQSIEYIAHSPYFESSLSDSDLPSITPDQHLDLSCKYILRGLQEAELKKGIPLTQSDKVMKCLDNYTVNVRITPSEDWLNLSVPQIRDGLYHGMVSNRKFCAVLKEDGWRHGGSLDYNSVSQVLTTRGTEEADIQYAWDHPIDLHRPVRFFIFTGPSGKIQTIVGQLNHVFTDGMGILVPLPSMFAFVGHAIPTQMSLQPEKRPHALPLWEDLWIGVRYGAWLVADVLKQCFTTHTSLPAPTIATFETKSVPQYSGMTFTESYLYDVLQVTQQPARVCIPANVGSLAQRVKHASANITAGLYTDFSPSDTKEQLTEKFKVFRSVTARVVTLFLGSFLASVFPWAVKQALGSISIIFSSLYCPTFDQKIGMNVVTPLQPSNTLGITALTVKEGVHHCIVSRTEPAKDIEARLLKVWNQYSQTAH